ncbi:proline--tRNA ligase [Picosynechococcus sp. PCC 8807]|uniref:proline--tRNA ligase n=1 Tax=Picosynechococcus sp. PCC 8807 TaxID=195248 RepID=UPI0008109CDA|nr:proline--tRNA ligase [Picosynechococcus sp. PCC 8807]ANV90645.1 proline--tRNA ligase [Picosynechococcus sp. PCC 8807]
MRLSQSLFVTLREDPADAEIPSHKLLLRAGYIRRIGRGIYAYLPLMWRVLQKVSQIVREEMNATGAQETLLPQLQPAEIWQESGRWDTYTQAEGIMFSLRDRLDGELGLGPTHEEVITTIAKDMIRSYRQLPQHLYQIQTKFRDEIRPRFGLMRGREFIMKDGYSFHASDPCLKQTYADMDQAYRNMLRRCGLQFRAVEADSGAIGGSGSQEFMILADAGEDEILYTEDEKYAANTEKAVSLPVEAIASPFNSFEKRETPNTATIESLCKFLDCSPTCVVKNVLYQVVYNNGKIVLALISIRGDQDVNEVKLQNELTKLASNYDAKTVISLTVPDAEAQQKWAAKTLPLGYISPALADDFIARNKAVSGEFLRFVDPTAATLKNFVTGADETNYHVLGANWGTEFKLPALQVDVRLAKAGDRAVHDPTQILQTARGIEAGHIFQLGTKYSEAMGATFTDENGKEQPLVMGCYGVGVSRLAQAAVEQSYDENGIIWPVAIAPYHAVVVVPNVKSEEQMAAAEKLYADLNAAGVETILDDRNERAGVKFKDAELIGIPFRVVTGKSLKDGKVEVVRRKEGDRQDLDLDDVVATLKNWVEAAGQ